MQALKVESLLLLFLAPQIFHVVSVDEFGNGVVDKSCVAAFLPLIDPLGHMLAYVPGLATCWYLL